MKSLMEELSVGSVVQNIEFYLLIGNLLYCNYRLIQASSYKKPKASIFTHLRSLCTAINASLSSALNLSHRLIRRIATIRQYKDDYHRLFEIIPVPMYIFDSRNFHFLEVNNAALNQYGYSRDEFLQLKITDIRPPEEVPAFLAAVGQVPGSYTDAGRWLHRKKTKKIFMSAFFPIIRFFKACR